MRAFPLLVALLLAGCTRAPPEPAPAPVFADVVASPALGEPCVTRNGAPEACVVVTLSAAQLRTDKPDWCGHWFGYDAAGRTFACLDANATRTGERAADIRLWMVYPERDTSAIMVSLLHVDPSASNITVRWAPPQG